jgi:uncharacterized protein (TIGR02246 family)
MFSLKRIGLLASIGCTGAAIAQTGSVEFEESVAVYGPGIFPALTQLRLCGDFRVLVAYVNGTDLLFVDEVTPIEGGSTNRVAKSFGFVEFNHYEASTSITGLACREGSAESLEITGTGHDGHENKDFEFRVLLNTRTGEYEYSDTLDAVEGQADSSAIRALLQDYEAAINRRDVEGAVAAYVPDADVWVVGYDRIVGIEAIRQNEARAVSAPGFQGWTASVDAIRFVGADVAVVESSGAVSIAGAQIAERITWVVNRTAVGWRIAAVRIMAFER